MRSMRAAVLAAGLLAIVAPPAFAVDPVWVEGEKPARADFKWVEQGNRPGILSEEKWLVSDEPKWKPEGLTVEYDLAVPKDGKYDLWLRIGFEWVRPMVAWRAGDGPWTTCATGVPAGPDRDKLAEAARKTDLDRRTTNVKELGEWAEVAWWNVGTADLKAGRAKLALRFSPAEGDRVLIALDAVCLVAGAWTPEGRLRPGQEYDGADDKRAAAQVFELPRPAGPADRAQVKLAGLWQVARYDDPDMDKDAYEPVKKIPGPEEYQLHWMGIQAPGSLWDNKETAFAHRVIYRTRVNVPAEHAGRGFTLHFSGTNWIASVFVNGKLAGTHEAVWVPWDLDVSKFIEPGKVNEIAVAIKGPYYAFDPAHTGSKSLERSRNLPRTRLQWSRWVAPIYPSTKGEGNGLDYGIVNPVTLVSAGRAYADDVFVKTSVARKRLEAEVTVRNTGADQRTFQVSSEAVCERDGKVEKTFGPADVTVPPGGTAVVAVAGEWANPKLWWPLPDPNLYRLRTTVSEGGKAVDVRQDTFGFREVTLDGMSIRLNGIRRNFWNWVEINPPPGSPEEWIAGYRRANDRFQRLCADLRMAKFLPAREDQLDF